MTILVTGATGNIGGEVIHHLLNKNATIRGLVRDRKKATKLQSQGVELAQGDFSQPDSLDAALQGIETAFLVMPNDPRQVELECNFIDSAKRAGVRHIVKLSVLRSGELPSTFQQWHRQIEEHLEKSGMSWTHLRPNMLMQNMRWFTSTISQQGAFYHSVGDTKISHVDARDVAAVAAVCLSESGHENQAYDLTGSEAVSFAQVADYLTAALNKPVQYINVAPADLKAARLANGEPEWYLDAEAQLFECWQAGAGSAVTSTIADLLHDFPTSFAAFVQDYVQSHAQDFLTTVGA
ncbi:SDR family oxidoreductase [Gloeocapsopsis sp. IPPAS B-1203]|uniref:SDR family oxidoreductase n=1 Tax=Gloeocapsopsis sp. IPPAS B-1203 TaxID=2049454 RepID=UPI000C177690|nr:SDR family oxidoreductase [Gloeocapsopsis sp. IPPAS B-1203]PIG92956.1 NAD(P)-dependent oxidoreductase [Gloeocapsopsis sp. IPPAS B-1203]